jgi:hypothetical protein
MSNKSQNSCDTLSKKKTIDTIPCRIEFIKNIMNGKNITSLVDFEKTDTEYYEGSIDNKNEAGKENSSDESQETQKSYDTRKVLKKRFSNFANTIKAIGGHENQLEYIKSGTTGHTFKGSVNDENGEFDYAVKVVAYPKKDKYGSIYDVRRPENAELKMIKVLSYFVAKKQTPHIVLPIGTFDTNIKTFTASDFTDVVGDDNDKYQEFLEKYKKGDYNETVSVLLSEWANRGDLLDFLRKFYNTPNFSEVHWKSIFFQLLSVLAIIQSKYPNFRHNDLKANNVLVHKIEKKTEIFTYRIAQKRYKVKNIGYQIKLWDYDFACIPGVVDNKKVEQEWTKQINVVPKQNRYYDVHYFFNTLIKRGFVSGIMTSDTVPQEVKDFINRVLPKKYQINPKAIKLKELINKKLIEKYKSLCKKFDELYAKSESYKKNENKEMVKKYHDLYYRCKQNDYGAKYIHNYYIPSEIKSIIMEIIHDNKGCDSGVLLGYVHEKGRLLVDDEYLTPQQILEEDPYFEEFRFFDDMKNNFTQKTNINTTNKSNNSAKEKNINNKYDKQEKKNNKSGPDITVFLNNSHYDPFADNILMSRNDTKKKHKKNTKGGSKKEKNKKNSKKGSKKKEKKSSKKTNKKSSKKNKKRNGTRSVDEELKGVDIDEILGI